jgi:hypothetical protein
MLKLAGITFDLNGELYYIQNKKARISRVPVCFGDSPLHYFDAPRKDWLRLSNDTASTHLLTTDKIINPNLSDRSRRSDSLSRGHITHRKSLRESQILRLDITIRVSK